MRDPDDIRYDLEVERRSLTALPAQAFQRRIDARQRIRELESELATATRASTEVLRFELEHLEDRYRQLAAARIGASFASGGIAGDGVDPDFLVEANRKIDHETGIRAIEERIREIRRQLATREE